MKIEKTLPALSQDGSGNIVLESPGAYLPSSALPPHALVSAPSGPTDTGVEGQVATDGTYIYVCTATDIWVRSAFVSTW